MSLPDFVAVNQEERKQLPSQGLVLVEMHWLHELIINFPLSSTFISWVGDSERIVSCRPGQPSRRRASNPR